MHISPRGLWKDIDEVECATLEWVDRYNNRRLRGPIGDVAAARYEAVCYGQESGQVKTARRTQESLRCARRGSNYRQPIDTFEPTKGGRYKTIQSSCDQRCSAQEGMIGAIQDRRQR